MSRRRHAPSAPDGSGTPDANRALIEWLDAHPGDTSPRDPEPRSPVPDSGKRRDRASRRKGGSGEPSAADALGKWLESHEVADKDRDGETRRAKGREAIAPSEFRALPCEASVDLHGMTAPEAEIALERFIDESFRRGRRKVLVIHGKGTHSRGDPVLARVARLVIERSPRAGRFEPAEGKDGGSGALYVGIRRQEGRG